MLGNAQGEAALCCASPLGALCHNEWSRQSTAISLYACLIAHWSNISNELGWHLAFLTGHKIQWVRQKVPCLADRGQYWVGLSTALSTQYVNNLFFYVLKRLKPVQKIQRKLKGDIKHGFEFWPEKRKVGHRNIQILKNLFWPSIKYFLSLLLLKCSKLIKHFKVKSTVQASVVQFQISKLNLFNGNTAIKQNK